jgi:hypothetical protein
MIAKPKELLPMKKVTIALPNWIGEDEAQDMVVRDLRAHALLKLEFYRSKMKPFEAKYATTFPRFQRRVEKATQEETASKPTSITRGTASTWKSTMSPQMRHGV